MLSLVKESKKKQQPWDLIGYSKYFIKLKGYTPQVSVNLHRKQRHTVQQAVVVAQVAVRHVENVMERWHLRLFRVFIWGRSRRSDVSVSSVEAAVDI